MAINSKCIKFLTVLTVTGWFFFLLAKNLVNVKKAHLYVGTWEIYRVLHEEDKRVQMYILSGETKGNYYPEFASMF